MWKEKLLCLVEAWAQPCIASSGRYGSLGAPDNTVAPEPVPLKLSCAQELPGGQVRKKTLIM